MLQQYLALIIQSTQPHVNNYSQRWIIFIGPYPCFPSLVWFLFWGVGFGGGVLHIVRICLGRRVLAVSVNSRPSSFVILFKETHVLLRQLRENKS